MAEITKVRDVLITANSSYIEEYKIDTINYLSIIKLIISSNSDDVSFIISYTEDDGIKWINPLDTLVNFLFKVYLSKGVPFTDERISYSFKGGPNHKFKIEIINSGSSAAKVSMLLRLQTS